jgi:hypothetical protein
LNEGGKILEPKIREIGFAQYFMKMPFCQIAVTDRLSLIRTKNKIVSFIGGIQANYVLGLSPLIFLQLEH